MSKAIILHLVFLSLVYQLTTQCHKFVKADEQLIQIECHNANVPEVCIQCLKSDPRSKNADKVGIAKIIVGCLSKHANILQANMTNLASSTEDDQFKTMLEKCKEALLFTDGLLIRTMLQLDNGKYDKAEHSTSEALWYEVSCDYIFGKHKSNLPTKVVYEMMLYKELSEAANRIIEQL